MRANSPPKSKSAAGSDYDFEPDPETILDTLLPRYVEARIYAENPVKDFLPATGKMVHMRTPVDVSEDGVDADDTEDGQRGDDTD